MARDDQYLDDVEEQEAADGMGTGVVVVSTLILIAAIIIIQLAMKEYGRGLFS